MSDIGDDDHDLKPVPGEFSLGQEGVDGTFRRQASWFRNFVSADGSTPYPAERGRYHLYVSWACPWAHRTIIGRFLKRLEGVVAMSVLDPIRDDRGWAFTGGEFVDAVNGSAFLSEKYLATDPAFDGRLTVPVLWDTQTEKIVSNESGDILRMLNSGFGDLADNSIDLYPEPHRAEIDLLNDRIYHTVNDAVYKAGFTTRQNVYEEEVRPCSRRSTCSTPVSRRDASYSAMPRWRRTGACSQRSSASTLCTTSTSRSVCAGSSTTQICGRTSAISTSSPGSPRRCASTTFAATTTAPIRW